MLDAHANSVQVATPITNYMPVVIGSLDPMDGNINWHAKPFDLDKVRAG